MNSQWTHASQPRRWLLALKRLTLTLLVFWFFIFLYNLLYPQFWSFVHHVQYKAYRTILNLDERWGYPIISVSPTDTTAPMQEEKAARFVAEQISHATNMYSLVEGCGVPADAVFNISNIWKLGQMIGLSKGPLEPSVFQNDILNLGIGAQNMSRKLADISYVYITDFDYGGQSRNWLQAAVKRLQIAQRYRRFLESPQTSWSSRLKIAGQLNKAIASLPRDLLRALSSDYEEKSSKLQAVIVIAEQTSRTGEEVRQTLERELVRAADELKRAPWYDTWGLYQFLGPSKFQHLREYLAVLKAGETEIRHHAETVSSTRDNLRSLKGYIDWYLENMIILNYHPSSLRALDQEVQAVEAALAHLLEQAELNGQFLKTFFVLGRPPRRVSRPERGLTV